MNDLKNDITSDIGNVCINCTVRGCSYNNELGNCTLPTVQIGKNSTIGDNGDITSNTICNSFCPSINLDYEMAEEILDNLND